MNIGHLNKSIISYRNMIDNGLILVPRLLAEYKMMKQADICRVSAMYKESIPDYIYDRLLRVEVKPY